MTPTQKIKHQILMDIIANLHDFDFGEKANAPITKENVDEIYDEILIENELQDFEEDFRCSGEDTNIECDYSRCYESKSVARKVMDGSWIGWTYWYGGGKHGEPGLIDWMNSAYELKVTEEEKLVVVRTFEKVETI